MLDYYCFFSLKPQCVWLLAQIDPQMGFAAEYEQPWTDAPVEDREDRDGHAKLLSVSQDPELLTGLLGDVGEQGTPCWKKLLAPPLDLI